MSISSVILFVSSVSHASIPCVQFIQNAKLPVVIVRLDTEEDRHKAANGYYLKVTEVPTLAVIYNGGDNIQLSIGSEKVLKRLQEFVPPPPVIEHSREGNGIAEKTFSKRGKKKAKNVHFEESEEEDMELLEPSPSPKKKKKTKNIPEGLETKLLIGEKKESPSLGVYDMAKRMEKERSSTLGYEEDKLPKY